MTPTPDTQDAVERVKRFLGQPFIVWTTEDKRQRDADLRLILTHLSALEERERVLVEALERIASDNSIMSGSFGPLMDIGFGYGWRAAQSIANAVLSTPNPSETRHDD